MSGLSTEGKSMRAILNRMEGRGSDSEEDEDNDEDADEDDSDVRPFASLLPLISISSLLTSSSSSTTV
jgi:hypothetical protein